MRRRRRTPSDLPTISRDTPLRLDVAAALAFPDGRDRRPWALPLDPDTASRFRASNNLERVRRQTALRRRPTIPAAVKIEAMAVQSHGLPIPDDLSIPDFLRRSNV
jgi:hypothetical protein